jgi:hypothetical protein
MCLEAVKEQYKHEWYRVSHGYMTGEGFAYNYIPENLWTAELCLEALKLQALGLDFSKVPENAKTAEVCLEAVSQSGHRLEYVPEKLKTPELCLEAVKNTANALEFVPEKLKTPEMCLIAAKGCYPDCRALAFMPENLKTAEIYFEAAKNFRDYGRDRYREARDWTYIVPKEFHDEVRRMLESEGFNLNEGA